MSWENRDYASGDPSRRADGFGGLGHGTGGRFADNPLNWSPTIGHFFRIRVRIHITLILFILFESMRNFGFATLHMSVVLFASILLHEFGHCFAARWVGGSADDILMWPLGGLASVDAPRRPKEQFITVVCGPLVTLGLIIISTIGLYAMGARIEGSGGFPYFRFIPGFTELPSQLTLFVYSTLNLVFAINSFLFIFNLLPMYPMDGGRMMHCALWKPLGFHKASTITCTIGMVVAVLVGLYAMMVQQYMLLAIALMGYLSCFQERQMVKAGFSQEDSYGGYDFSGGYSTMDSPERPRKPGFFAKWKQKKQQGKWRQQREREAAVQEQVDGILDKVKREGIGSLSNKEKKLLEEATRRQNAADRRHGV
ncbi:MAG TPA: site-2 protease family protein [Phycisphaerae bacterium]|nr:site-2 protease family protein [Phycisphaerae bacterium]HRW54276.1 site-2 protease family protein [Phycisphaerae bacterium]